MLQPFDFRKSFRKVEKRRRMRSTELGIGMQRLESLETRDLLSTFTVNSLNDTGAGSLRSAIDQANDEVTNPGQDHIVFDLALSNGTIPLASNDTNHPLTMGPTAFIISSDIVIDGQGANITLDGQDSRRVFGVLATGELAIRGLTITGGEARGGDSGAASSGSSGGGGAGLGGAIFNAGKLTIYDSVFVENAAFGGNAGAAEGSRFGPTNGSGGGAAASDGASSAGGDTGGGGAGLLGPGTGTSGGAGEGGTQAAEGVDGINGGGGGAGADGTSFSLGGFGGGGGGASDYGGYAAGMGGFGGGGGGGATGRNGGIGGFGGGGGGSKVDYGGGAAGFGGTRGTGGLESPSGVGGGGAGMGGAIFNNGGLLTIVNSTFNQNLAQGGQSASLGFSGHGYGGAIFNRNGVAVIVDTDFTNNAARRSSELNDYGGAIYNLGDGNGSTQTTQRLTNSTTGTLLTDNNTFTGNTGVGTIRHTGFQDGDTIDGPVDSDFADAPATYAVLLANSGPSHRDVGPKLGVRRETEVDGLPHPLASGDDLAGDFDDEDGVVFSNLVAGQTGTATVTVNDAPFGARLNAWIDFNQDGTFSGENERIAEDLLVQNGNNVVTFNVPGDATAPLFARFRLSTDGGDSTTGMAADGEVEDYFINSVQTNIGVTVKPSTVAEESGTSLIYTFTRLGDLSGPLTVGFTLGGTATLGTDYTISGAGPFEGLTSSVILGGDISSVQIIVTPIGDFQFEFDETVIVTIDSSEAYSISTPGFISGTIVDDDAANYVITESNGTTELGETGSTDTFTVVLVSQPAGDVVINLSSGNSALATLSNASLTFNASNWSIPQEVTVTGASDELPDGATSLAITLSIDDALSVVDYQELVDQTVTVYLAPVNDNNPVFTSPSGLNVPENSTSVGTVTATDSDLPHQQITYSITGGIDAGLFSITPDGVLSFNIAPDYEIPGDSDGDRIYEIEITADDNSGFGGNGPPTFSQRGDESGRTTVQTVFITVTPVNEFAPELSSPSAFTVTENETSVGNIIASDSDLPAQPLSYTISGGADANLFTLDPQSGILAFEVAPDFENPSDTDGDHVYDIEITVNDGNGLTSIHLISVSVTSLNDNAPLFTSPTTFDVPENLTVVGTVVATDADLPDQLVTYTKTGGMDAALFDLDANTGVLTFNITPDFETPSDVGADNVYEIQVTASDNNGLTTIQSIFVTVTPVNEHSPVITSPVEYDVRENRTSIGTIVATDVDLPNQVLTYSIVGGVDADHFELNSTTGVLTFKVDHDFEIPTDVGADNTYEVQIEVNDNSGLSTLQNLAVTVTPANDNGPVFTSPDAFTVVENSTVVATLTATDADLPAVAIFFDIFGGVDAALFDLNRETGVLTFKQAPDFEVPTDSNTDNIYQVRVAVNDGGGFNSVQDLTITVTPINDHSPVLTSSATFTIPEGTTPVSQITATDADLPAQTLTFNLAEDVDGALFTISPTGQLAFKSAPDFLNPSDIGADNAYQLVVKVNDGAGSETSQSITVNVTFVSRNSAPVFTSTDNFTITEGTSMAGTVVATDVDVPTQTLNYSITSGADQALFSIDPTTGVLTFVAAPNFENPLDSNADNDYELQVTVNDGNGGLTAQNIIVSVTNVFELPAIEMTAEPGTYYLGKVRAFVDPTASLVVNDTTEPDYSDARLVVSITQNRNRRDVLSIFNKGAPSTLIRMDDHRITYDHVLIGSFRGGSKDEPDLVIEFNAAATNAAIDALLKRINFATTYRRLPQPARTISMQLLNVNGQDTEAETRSIAIARQARRRRNDPT